jgi:hypothetical protein
MGVFRLKMPWLWKRFNSNAIEDYVGAVGEPILDMRGPKPIMRISDGTTVGGIPVAKPIASQVHTPSILFPIDGAFNIEAVPIVTSTSFMYTDGRIDGVIHLSSRWQVADNLAFVTPILDTGWIGDLTTIDLSTYMAQMPSNSGIYVRVRYKSHYGDESEWSPASGFSSASGLPEALIESLKADTLGGTSTIGYALDISDDGSTVVVGADDADFHGVNSGQVHIYKRNAAGWALDTTLYGNSPGANKRFGFAVAISGNGSIIAVGAVGDTECGLYVYEYSQGSWNHIDTRISASNVEFGYSVAADFTGNTILTSSRLGLVSGVSSGLVTVYKRNGSSYVNSATLTPVVPLNNESFGNSISVSDDGLVVAIGSTWSKQNGSNTLSGGCFVFSYNGTSWDGILLSPLDGKRNDHYGVSVSLSGDGTRLAIGSYKNSSTKKDTGAVYVYHYENTNWLLDVKLFSNSNTSGCAYGYSVSMAHDGNLLAVGSYGDDSASRDNGAVFVYALVDNAWVEYYKHTSPNGLANDYFGTSVAFSDLGILAVGAYGVDPTLINSGSIYLYGG